MYLERWQSDTSEWMPGYGGGSSVFSLQKDVLALLEHVKSNMDSIIMVRSSRSLDFFFQKIHQSLYGQWEESKKALLTTRMHKMAIQYLEFVSRVTTHHSDMTVVCSLSSALAASVSQELRMKFEVFFFSFFSLW